MFDTLDSDLMCKKLKAYGFDNIAVSWFFSFLTNRTQKVKIGGFTSLAMKLTSGVPQGGISKNVNNCALFFLSD